ncbi:MAG: hypothetical protein EA428_08350 [Spirochaetaceae bacterium]|nr:MAG: hypothetical protein EA428_08350 [Spirochaetaceae bacterium]
MKTSTNTLLNLLRSLPPVHLQNNLMGCTDRDLAMCAVLLESRDEALLLAPLSPRKRLRVQEEAALIARRRIPPEHFQGSLELVERRLRSGRPAGSVRSYLRPKGRDGGNTD